jgi:hypothetical protein
MIMSGTVLGEVVVSLRPRSWDVVPAETARGAGTVFPDGCLAMRARDALRRAATVADDRQCERCRESCLTPPTHRPATAARRPTPANATRGQGVPRHAARAAGPHDATPTPAPGQPGHDAAVASRPDQTPPRPRKREPRTGTSEHAHLDPPPHPAPGSRKPLLGVSAYPRRARPPQYQGRSLHSLGDPQDRWRRPVSATDDHSLGQFPALPSRCHPGDGLH